MRNSQNNLQLHGSSQPKANMSLDNQGGIIQQPSSVDRLSSSQRPQSAYYGNQTNQNLVQSANGIRAAQSTKDLPMSTENYQTSYQRGNYPSMPNVNQGYTQGTMQSNQVNQSYNQLSAYSAGGANNMIRGSAATLPSNHYNSQFSAQSPAATQSPALNSYGNQNSYNNQMPNGSMNTLNLRGQAKLAEMSEEVTRRQQRASMNLVQKDNSLLSPVQHNRYSFVFCLLHSPFSD